MYAVAVEECPLWMWCLAQSRCMLYDEMAGELAKNLSL